MSVQIPHPIPYQGSKRKLCSNIATFVRSDVNTLFEPFAGSAAFTLYAAKHDLAKRFVIGDSLEPLVELWKMIVLCPAKAADEYRVLWEGQTQANPDYYNQIREEYNKVKDPVMLLYLVARCVKNAVRFSKNGDFTQSVDRRRIGMNPLKMKEAICGASALLTGRVEFFTGDFADCLRTADEGDLVYMDPPYQGTTYGRDKRYYQQLPVERLCEVLYDLNARNVPFLLSYDGMHGDKEYGVMLPDDLDMQKTLINSGRSTQATLNGKNIITMERLYLSKDLIQQDLPSLVAIGQQGQMPLGI